MPIGVEESAVTLADRLRHAILPGLTLSVTGVANVALHTREKLIDALEDNDDVQNVYHNWEQE